MAALATATDLQNVELLITCDEGKATDFAGVEFTDGVWGVKTCKAPTDRQD